MSLPPQPPRLGWRQSSTSSTYYSFPLIDQQQDNSFQENPYEQHPRTYQAGSTSGWFTARRQNSPNSNPTYTATNDGPSQPVVVRPYPTNNTESGNVSTSRRARKIMNMGPWKRLSYSLGHFGSNESSWQQQKQRQQQQQQKQKQRPEKTMPLVEDFSIESILQAIEPDIRDTLDTIAEIYGRSKLSLANEHSSHMQPLGEIRAPPGGLVTVEEASPDNEGGPLFLAATSDIQEEEGEEEEEEESNQDEDEDETSSNDSNNRADDTHTEDDHHYPPRGRPYYVQQMKGKNRLRPGGSMSISPSQVELDTSATTMVSYPTFDSNPDLPSLTISKEFTSTPKHSGRALLGKVLRPYNKTPKNNNGKRDYNDDDDGGGDADKHGARVAPAVVSEVHFVALADSHYPLSMGMEGGENPTMIGRRPDSSNVSCSDSGSQRRQMQLPTQTAHIMLVLADLQNLLGWFRGSTREGASNSYQGLESAEARLRTMLERQGGDHPDVSVGAV